MVMFWVALLAVSILLYVLLDGFDLGVGMLFGLTRREERRRAMLSAVAPIWDGNETWLVVTAVILWGAFPIVYATLFSAFYLPSSFATRRNGRGGFGIGASPAGPSRRRSSRE